MTKFENVDAVLDELRPGMTVKDLAANMCDPFWRSATSAIGDEIMISIPEMRRVGDEALAEIQHALVAEFVELLDSPEERSRISQVLGLMKEFIDPETNRALLAAVLQEGLGEQESQDIRPEPRPRLKPSL